jgi:hypothetical protein
MREMYLGVQSVGVVRELIENLVEQFICFRDALNLNQTRSLENLVLNVVLSNLEFH